MAERNIKIPERLMIQLVKYHLCGIRDEEIERFIKQELEKKMQAVSARAEYMEKHHFE